MKKAVLFDLDDTLYDYHYAHKKALGKVYSVLVKQVRISKKKFLKFYKMANDEIKNELAGTASSHNRVLYFQRVIEKTHNTVEPKIILKMYKVYWDTFLQNMRLKKGVIETLKKLQKQKIKIALVTDLTAHIQLRKIEKLKLTRYVDYLVTSEESGGEKPNAIMFLLALNKLNILPSEAIMVGDNLICDIEGANSVKIDSVAITNKKIKADKEDYKKPNFVIREIPEVLKIINEFNN
ncbi:MAG: HAD-IA family hydrolase [Candidatus Pacearchaeota archaeon]|jgi:putative hydrolase of the HAD superfamily